MKKITRKNVELTSNQAWVYDFVKDSKGWISPTAVGKWYGLEVLKKKDCSSSTGSPLCMKLVALGLFERNVKGQYRIFTKSKVLAKKVVAKNK